MGLIEVAEYRKLGGGKVERVYAPSAVEPPGEDASPAEVARFLAAMLELTRTDINAATMAKEGGERREIALGCSVVRLNLGHVAELRTRLEELVASAREHPDEDGVFTTVLWSIVDHEDRNTAGG